MISSRSTLLVLLLATLLLVPAGLMIHPSAPSAPSSRPGPTLGSPVASQDGLSSSGLTRPMPFLPPLPQGISLPGFPAPASSTPRPTWSTVDGPSPRFGAAYAYDPVLGGTVLFGGVDFGVNEFGDTWLFSSNNNSWQELLPPDSPTPRAYATLAYDPTDQMLILFGGDSLGAVEDDTWGLVINSTTRSVNWENLTDPFPTPENTPSGRLLASMAEEVPTGILLYGGYTLLKSHAILLGDTWLFSVATGWRQTCLKGGCGPVTPGPVVGGSMAYSVLTGDDILYGGDIGPSLTNATWVYNSTGWWNVTDQLTPSPTARWLGSMAPLGGFLELSGGLGPSGNILSDTWQLDPTTPRWTAGTSPTFGTWLSAFSEDPVLGKDLLFGGLNATFLTVGVLWTYDGSTWSPDSGPVASHPGYSWGMGMVYDAADGYVVAFSPAWNNSAFPTTWKYVAGTWTNITPSLVTSSNSPTARFYFGLAYDAQDAEVILFGGMESATSHVLSDTWAFKGGTWTNVTPVTSPPSVEDPSLSQLSNTGGVLLFGGWSPVLGYTGGTWVYAGGIWTQLSPSSSPSPREAAALTLDTTRNATLLYGGYGTGAVVLEDTWEFFAQNSSWVALCSPKCAGSNPTNMFNPTLGYDARDNLTVLVGGYHGVAWFFYNYSWYTLYAFPFPSPRSGPLMTWDGAPNDGYLFLYGGYYGGTGNLYDNWAISPLLTPAPPKADRTSLDATQQLLTLAAPVTGGGTGGTTEHWENLPEGCLGLTGENLSCTPTQPGIYQVFNLAVPSDGLATMTGSPVQIRVDPPLVISSLPVANRTFADLGQNVAFSVNLSGGSGTYTNTWRGVSTIPCAGAGGNLSCVMTHPGNFSISMSTVDGNGYSLATGNLSFTVYSSLTVSVPVVSPFPLYLGGTLHLSSAVSGGTGGYTYLWTGLPPGCPSASAANLTCTPTATGVFSGNLSVTDSAGLTVVSGNFLVDVQGTPTPLSVQAHASLVSGSAPLPVTFNASSSGGNLPVVYHWRFGDGSVGAGSRTTHTYLAPGTFTATVWANDSAGQSAQANVTVTIQAGPLAASVYATPATVVVGQSTTLLAEVAGGVAPYGYSWKNLPAGCTSSDTSNLTCQPTSSGHYTVEVTVTDSQGKTSVVSVTLVVLSPSAPASEATAPAWIFYVALGVLLAAIALVLLRWVGPRFRRNQPSPPPTAPLQAPSDPPPKATSPPPPLEPSSNPPSEPEGPPPLPSPP